MHFDFNSDKPIYIQLAEGIKDAILGGAFEEETQVPSTTEISMRYKINPATALKGLNILVDSGMLYKKRGVGMFVSKGAAKVILKQRQKVFFDTYVNKLVEEAEKLNISKEEIIDMIKRGFKDE
ncbi:MAG: GntR family transcriptional regulator [Oscillospiraceae bacterium]